LVPPALELPALLTGSFAFAKRATASARISVALSGSVPVSIKT